MTVSGARVNTCDSVTGLGVAHSYRESRVFYDWLWRAMAFATKNGLKKKTQQQKRTQRHRPETQLIYAVFPISCSRRSVSAIATAATRVNKAKIKSRQKLCFVESNEFSRCSIFFSVCVAPADRRALSTIGGHTQNAELSMAAHGAGTKLKKIANRVLHSNVTLMYANRGRTHAR